MSYSNTVPSKFSPRTLVKAWQRMYREGSEVVLDHMCDDPHPIPKNTHGVLKKVDDAGQFWVNWENGASLAVIPGVDVFRVKASLGRTKAEKFAPVFMTAILPRGDYAKDAAAGVVLNRRAYPCQMEGCTGMRMRVLWPDGKVTYPCSKGCSVFQDASPLGEVLCID